MRVPNPLLLLPILVLTLILVLYHSTMILLVTLTALWRMTVLGTRALRLKILGRG